MYILNDNFKLLTAIYLDGSGSWLTLLILIGLLLIVPSGAIEKDHLSL